jgi:hypothetical protein
VTNNVGGQNQFLEGGKMGRLTLLQLMEEDFMIRLLGQQQWRRCIGLHLDPDDFLQLFEPYLTQNNLWEELRMKVEKVASPEWEHPSLPMPLDWDYKGWYENLLRRLKVFSH